MPSRPQIPVRRQSGVKHGSHQSLKIANLLQEGIELHRNGRLNDAGSIYERILEKQSNHFDATRLLAAIYLQKKQSEIALKYFDKALQINKKHPATLFDRGNALRDLIRLDEALASYEEALRIKPDFADAYYNRGDVLRALKRLDGSLASYDEALRIKPDFAEAYNNRGVALRQLKRFDEALASYEEALRIKPDYGVAYANRGNVLSDLKRLDEAIASHEKALLINPDSSIAYANLVLLRHTAADWRHWQSDIETVVTGNNAHLTSNFSIFALQSFPGLSSRQLLEFASKCISVKLKLIKPRRESLNFPTSPSRTGRLNLGFLSMDLCDHIVMRLLSSFFETLNRDKFNLFAYSYGVDDKSLLRKKAENSFNVFRDVRSWSNEEVAKQIAADQIHILIDLAGHTKGNRLEITLLKPAPITVHMVSDAGTLGAGAVDYKVVNAVTAAEEFRAEAYAEALILIPPSIRFDTSVVPPAPEARSSHNLPEGAFVFCSFNVISKLNPPLYDCWMRILKEVPQSILWLWADDSGVQNRLRAEAKVRGVDETRLIFAKRVPLSRHYARMQLADLALDTFPYGSHSTGSHALWCGVPLLGFTGETPASRVSAALLTVCGLPELSIEGGYEVYAEAAIELAKDRQRLALIRQKLIETVRQEGDENPFSINRYVKVFEAAMEQVWRRHEQGLPVETFEVQL